MHPVDLFRLSAEDVWRHIAVHEAGHAVVGLSLGLGIVDIDLGSAGELRHQAGSLVLGATRFEAPDNDLNQLARERPTQMGVACMAGVSAEEVFMNSHLDQGWEGDLRLVRIGHGWIASMTRDQQKRLCDYIDEARLSVTRQSLGIRAVADGLLSAGKLTGAEVTALVSRATDPR